MELHHHTCLQKCSCAVAYNKELLNVEEDAYMTLETIRAWVHWREAACGVCWEAVLSCVHEGSSNLLLCTVPCSWSGWRSTAQLQLYRHVWEVWRISPPPVVWVMKGCLRKSHNVDRSRSSGSIGASACPGGMSLIHLAPWRSALSSPGNAEYMTQFWRSHWHSVHCGLPTSVTRQLNKAQRQDRTLWGGGWIFTSG